MIQFNLLPDIKLTFVKAQRAKRRTISIAFIVTAFVVGLFVMMLFYVQIIQKRQLSNLDKDIKESSEKISAVKDLDKVLTVQNQLGSLAELHQSKPVATRLYDYLNQITPAKINLSTLSLDFGTTTLTISGTTDSLQTINQFADTLKFTTYKVESAQEGKNAFPSVVLSNFSRDEKSASYEFSITYDPALFDSTSKVVLNVPQQQITSRSYTEQPIFSGNGEGN